MCTISNIHNTNFLAFNWTKENLCFRRIGFRKNMKVVSKYKVQSWTLNIDWWSRGECGDPAPHYISHMDQIFNINRNTYFTMVQPQSKSPISIIHQNWIIYYATIKSKSCYGQNAMPTKKICLQSRPLSSWNIHLNISGCCTVVYSCTVQVLQTKN